MCGSPIKYFDRYTRRYCVEDVYGERALRFAYENPAGRILSRLVFARPLASRMFGWYMSRPASRKKILPFISDYGLDPDEFTLSPEDYGSFNAFFCRRLKADRRPIDQDPGSVVFPADGRHMGWQELGKEAHVFVKGQKWNLAELFDGDTSLADRFEGGTMVMSRLCPVDYHHFHFPVGGILKESFWSGKFLYSVSPIALRNNLSYLWRNKRCMNLIETHIAGLCCFIEVGATNVGTIRHHTLPDDRCVEKGQLKGWFEFGGSTVLTLFERGRVRLSEDLLKFSAEGIELYGKVGDQMGHIVNQQL